MTPYRTADIRLVSCVHCGQRVLPSAAEVINEVGTYRCLGCSARRQLAAREERRVATLGALTQRIDEAIAGAAAVERMRWRDRAVAALNVYRVAYEANQVLFDDEDHAPSTETASDQIAREAVRKFIRLRDLVTPLIPYFYGGSARPEAGAEELLRKDEARKRMLHALLHRIKVEVVAVHHQQRPPRRNVVLEITRELACDRDPIPIAETESDRLAMEVVSQLSELERMRSLRFRGPRLV